MGRMRWFGLSAMVMALAAASGCAAQNNAIGPAGTPAPEVVVGRSAGQPAPSSKPGAPAAGDEGVAAPASKGAAEPREEQAAEDPAARPGLGTEWGETRTSHISNVTFLRGNPTTPFATASLFYNDEEGARAMSGAAGFRRTGTQAFAIAGGAVEIGLRGEDGRSLSGFVTGDKRFAVGEAGLRYSIVLRNLTPNRFECVISVDGLDVIDGQSGSFSKRGYILEPQGELEIDGFRQSMDEVAAFRFGSVRGSYANQKHGDVRNVGVIGVALFHERGTTLWTPEEIQLRQTANPFPGQLATP